jgi:AP endonuclease-2
VGERDEGRESPVLWDVCRGFHEGRKGMYTHWDQKINARPGNYGSRIDFILCSISMKPWISASNIQEGLMVGFVSLAVEAALTLTRVPITVQCMPK